MAIRPPGLGDSPGAAAVRVCSWPLSGSRSWDCLCRERESCSGFLMGMAGVVVIFLSHVRSSLVVVVGCAFVYSIIMICAGTLEDRI